MSLEKIIPRVFVDEHSGSIVLIVKLALNCLIINSIICLLVTYGVKIHVPLWLKINFVFSFHEQCNVEYRIKIRYERNLLHIFEVFNFFLFKLLNNSKYKNLNPFAF